MARDRDREKHEKREKRDRDDKRDRDEKPRLGGHKAYCLHCRHKEWVDHGHLERKDKHNILEGRCHKCGGKVSTFIK